MADLVLNVPAGEVSVTSTAKTFLTMKAPANQRLKIKGIEIFGKGISNTDTPVKVELGIITTDGETGTATAVTAVPNDNDLGETPQGTYYKNYGTEPTTYGNILKTWEIQPQTGLVFYFPVGSEIKLKGGTELGIRLTSNQNETMSLTAVVEE
jgi:hypothetical protein